MHKSNGGNIFWDTIKDEVIDKYLNQNRSSNSIARDYSCSGYTILHHLKRWGVAIRKDRYNNIYSLDAHFFDIINSEEKAYILGLLLSDGHISKQGSIMLTLKDKDVLNKYLKALHCNIPIKIDRYGNYAVNIKSKALANALNDIGLHNRKSYKIDIDRILKSVPKELEHHFVRGMFDGDGSIKIYRYDYLKNPQLHFGYTGLSNVVDYIRNFLGITTKNVKESELTYTCVSSCRKTICKIYEILYKDATIYMERKYDTFRKIIDMRGTFNDYNGRCLS